MNDLYETELMCNTCKKKTVKSSIEKGGFIIRTWECASCGKTWHHPLDAQEYLKFNKLKKQQFEVKLRKVGNSFAATIPNEIITFEGLEEGTTVRMQLESANKVTIILR